MVNIQRSRCQQYHLSFSSQYHCILLLLHIFMSFCRVGALFPASQRLLFPHSRKVITAHNIQQFRTKMSVSLAAQGITREEGGEEDRILVDNMHGVRERMDEAARTVERDPSSVRLVAVSKTKPIEDIRALYSSGHRHFGENYFQELLEKAPLLPSDICWHFIGHLQSSKSNKLIRDVPNLYMIETIDSDKLASKLQSACELAGRTRETRLRVLIQVDTSGEDTKNGVEPSQVGTLATFIQEQCPLLQLRGVMTIGAPGDLTCFDRLVEARHVVAEAIGLSEEEEASLELSMGMSGDFPDAIARGATSVRVGSTIFGPRAYPPKK